MRSELELAQVFHTRDEPVWPNTVVVAQLPCEKTVTAVPSAVARCAGVCPRAGFAADLLQNRLSNRSIECVANLPEQRVIGSYTGRMLRRYRRTVAVQEMQLDEADLADDQTVKQIDEQLHREHPEVFDSRGRLRRGAVARVLQRLGGVRLNGDQVDEMIRIGRSVAARRARATSQR
jgi:hypothetical protein